MNASAFHLHSLGIAVENKPRDSKSLNVLPSETANTTDGEINLNPTQETVEGTDSNGQSYQVKTTSERSLVCMWLPSEDNRATPPDIMRNEWVEIWRKGDSDQYYWRSMGHSGKRALESVVYTWNASPNPGGGGVDFATCYFFAVSAHDKHITIGTSKANGEPYAWTFQINTGKGEFTLCDDIGNEFEIVSRDNKLQLKNPDGTFFKIERQTIEMEAAQYIQLKVGGTVYRLTPESAETTTTNIKDTATAIDLSSATYTNKSGKVLFNTGSFDIKG